MGARRRSAWLWAAWGGTTVIVLLLAAAVMSFGGPRHLLLIGKSTSAHHQMELACTACHTNPFGGRDAIEASCLSCHGDDLRNSNDSHPASKFRDPRNADRLAVLDATKCLTCHVEHRPEITGPMAVTIPGDFCVACHADIAEERPSHRDLSFATCAGAGCHNFHDNRALYEDFLEKHIGEPWLKPMPRVELANWRPASPYLPGVRPATAPDAPAGIAAEAHVANDWLASAHARGGVNCSGCHQPPGAAAANASSWIGRPGMAQCATCHAGEAQGFTQGRHGMRLAEGMWTSRRALFGLIVDEKLSPMRPELARLPMKSSAHGTELGCTTCHQAHDFDRKRARVEACASCHDDRHTKDYFTSPHFRLWQAELGGRAPPGSGVTCATCHMPRVLQRGDDGLERAVVIHNQNDNLRPNEKMARGVCLDCHGLGFTLDALADDELVARNFKGRSSIRIESLDWVEQRVRQRGQP